MIAKCLTITGLLFDIAGVALVWWFAFPQPNLEPGVAIEVEDDTPVGPNGETAKGMNGRTEAKRKKYKTVSTIGLALIVAGFALQLVAQLIN